MKGLIFTYFLTYGGAFISIFDPYLGLLIYVCFALVRPESMWYWSVPEGNYSRIVAVAMLAGWAIKGFGNWQLGRAGGIVFAFVGYLIWSMLGAALAPDQEVAWHFVEELLKIVLPFLVGITMIDSVAKLKNLAWVITLSEGYLAFQLNLDYYYYGFNRVQEMGFGGMDNNSVAIGMVACMGLSFFLGFGASKLWHKLLAFLCAALMGHVVLLAFSRGGMLALIVTGLVAFVLVPKQPKHVVIVVLACLLALRVAGKEVRERFFTSFADPIERDESAQSRVEMWKVCWQIMLDQPILGVGPDHWPLVAEEYGFKLGKEAHSVWLQTGAELGFPGLGFLALFYTLSVKRLLSFTRRKAVVSDPWFRDSGRMVVVAIVGFASAAQFVTLEGLEIPYYVTLIGACALKLSSASASVSGAYRVALPYWQSPAVAATATPM